MASIQMADVAACACPTDGVIELIGKKWTLCLLATVANRQPIRFNQLKDELGTVSPKTLSDTLAALQKHGILTRTAFPEMPPRVEYALTTKGTKLVNAIAPLMDWAKAHSEAAACCTSGDDRPRGRSRDRDGPG